MIADESVRCIRTRKDGGKGETGFQFRWHVLEGMHGQLRAAFKHRDFQFLEEQTLAANRRQWLVQDLIAARGQRHQLHPQTRVRCA